MTKYNGVFTLVLALLLVTVPASSQTTAFKYQGSLTDGGSPANGSFQMQFKLFDAVSGGSQIGSTLNDVPVTAANGVFSATLDFGSNALSGANRWIEIAVRRNSGESYVTLSPRQQIASSPYAVRTLSAATADDSLKLGGVNANQFVQTNDARLTDARNPLPGSANYIQNAQTPQATSNFNISGTGTATGFNVNGPLSFGNIAQPPVAPVGQSRFYYDTANNKIRVSENGGAYVNLVGAAGISGSGTVNRLPFWSAGTTLGDSVVAQSGNFIGIGTTTPAAGLEVRGTGFSAGQRLTDNSSGNSLVLQSGAGNNMKVTGYNYNISAAVPLYLSVDGANTILNSAGGSVGIGTATPTHTLDVNGFFRAASVAGGNVVSETSGGTNAWAKLWTRTPVQSWSIGTSNNFNGNELYFANENTGNIRMSIKPDGNVTQGIPAYGLPKAMLYVLANGWIIRCYNGQTGVSLINNQTFSGCGYSVSHTTVSFYDVTVDFDVSQRFFFVTQSGAFIANCGGGGATISSFGGSTVRVLTSCGGFGDDRTFWLVIY